MEFTAPVTSEKEIHVVPEGIGTSRGSVPAPSPAGAGGVVRPAPKTLSVASMVAGVEEAVVSVEAGSLYCPVK